MVDQKQRVDSAEGGTPAGFWLTFALASYLLAIAAGACAALVSIFPSSPSAGSAAAAPLLEHGVLPFGDIVWAGRPLLKVRGPDQGLVLLALLAGTLGSFMHAAPSLAAYVGNRQLRASWALWYALRPPTGAILGLLFYFIIRAGLIPAATAENSNAVSPYGVVAFGALAGWFSKRATDKLAEVFETLFRTAKDLEYKDKLAGNGKPKIIKIDPPTIELAAHAGNDVVLTLTCEKLAPGAWATVDGQIAVTRSVDDTHLSCTLPNALLSAGKSVKIVITNPPPANAPAGTKSESSDAIEIAVI